MQVWIYKSYSQSLKALSSSESVVEVMSHVHKCPKVTLATPVSLLICSGVRDGVSL